MPAVLVVIGIAVLTSILMSKSKTCRREDRRRGRVLNPILSLENT